jgi:hypothetical protein
MRFDQPNTSQVLDWYSFRNEKVRNSRMLWLPHYCGCDFDQLLQSFHFCCGRMQQNCCGVSPSCTWPFVMKATCTCHLPFAKCNTLFWKRAWVATNFHPQDPCKIDPFGGKCMCNCQFLPYFQDDKVPTLYNSSLPLKATSCMSPKRKNQHRRQARKKKGLFKQPTHQERANQLKQDTDTDILRIPIEYWVNRSPKLAFPSFWLNGVLYLTPEHSEYAATMEAQENEESDE